MDGEDNECDDSDEVATLTSGDVSRRSSNPRLVRPLTRLEVVLTEIDE